MIILRKTIFLFVIILVFTMFFTGCTSNSMEDPPKISIFIDDKKIEYITAKNKWNGYYYDREDTFVTILKEQKDISVIPNGSIVEIAFQNNPPDKFSVSDILIDENGRPIYTEKEIKSIPVELNKGKCSFEIERHFATSLSSYYYNDPDKKDIRGFRMIASWGENECEYAFVIKTINKSIE